MKRYFLITLFLCGCASFNKGAVIDLIETVVSSSIEYLREHPDALLMSRYGDATVSDDASISDASTDLD